MSQLADALKNRDNTTSLILGSLSAFPEDVLQLRALEFLYLSAEPGVSIALPMALSELPKLRRLTLYLAIDALPAWLGKMTRVKELELGAIGDAREVALPSWVTEMTWLEKLGLSGNFAALPDGLAALAALQELDLLHARPFQKLPPALLRLGSLRRLTLHVDALDGIGALGALEALTVSASALSEVPGEIGRLTSLRTLELSSTKLKALPKELGKLAALEQLKLYGNQLERLPESLSGLVALKSLDISNNPALVLGDELGELQALEELQCNQATIRALPASIGRLKKLQKIWGTYGALASIPPEIGGSTALRTIYLTNQAIAALPKEIGMLKKLEWLHLKNNPLGALPEEILQCTALTELELSGCTFSAEALQLVEKVAKLPKIREVNRPRVAAELPPPPTSASRERLPKKIVDQIERLGGKLLSPAEIPAQTFVETKGGRWPVPEAIRQLQRDVKWPERTTFTDDDGIWLAQFGYGTDLSEYECDFYHPYDGIAITDGGNYSLLVDLSDEQATDPMVYRLDHEGWSEHDAPAYARLSELLAALKVDER